MSGSHGRDRGPGSNSTLVPDDFADAVGAMRAAPLRPEVFCEEMPAPQRIAPYAFALSADVTLDGVDVGTGRLILLHDPDGNEAWEGTYRCVAYVRADVDTEMMNDPLLGEVGWTWLLDALAHHDAEAEQASGTVTRVATESFGTMSDDGGSGQIEIRASWTPDLSDPATAAAHVRAWSELLCQAAGLEPLPEGVAAMPSRRGQRGGADPR